jgi:2-polyprenyl-3-methyl-5-hydroxy-6-metoxy-1,4-benzoquinol methylase
MWLNSGKTMLILCPACQQSINLQTGVCIGGHKFLRENGVLDLMDPDMKEHIRAIEKHRLTLTQQLPTINDYNALPFSLSHQHFEWLIRAYDVRKVLNLIRSRTEQNILEIGAWNGWLTHHLARAGYEVVAVDYTADENDGLGAKIHFDIEWTAIQIDLTNLSVFDCRFDVIVINHGLHFFSDPVDYVQGVKKLLKPNGLLILLNLTFYRNPAQRILQVEKLTSDFMEAYGMPIFLKPTRGYMDFEDKHQLQKQGITLRLYRHLWRANLKARIRKTASAYYYGFVQC